MVIYMGVAPGDIYIWVWLLVIYIWVWLSLPCVYSHIGACIVEVLSSVATWSGLNVVYIHIGACIVEVLSSVATWSGLNVVYIHIGACIVEVLSSVATWSGLNVVYSHIGACIVEVLSSVATWSGGEKWCNNYFYLPRASLAPLLLKRWCFAFDWLETEFNNSYLQVSWISVNYLANNDLSYQLRLTLIRIS